jgi:flagellar motor switch protein FliN/FliY
MADNMDFESFENLDDLDWSSLEKDIKDQKQGDPGAGGGAAPAAAAGGGGGGGAMADSNAARVTGGKSAIDINYLLDVNLQVTVEVGRRQYYISQLLGWDHGSIVELDRLIGEPLHVLVNNKPVAKGEVVVVNDKFALKITSILDPHDRLAFLSHH